MELKKLSIDVQKLKGMPKPEIELLLALQIILGEIKTLNIILLCIPTDSPNQIVGTAQNCQRLFIMRMLASKVFEAWDYLKKMFWGNKLSLIYEPLLNEEGTQALEKLKSYFKNSNSLKNVRNDYSFHYSDGAKMYAKKLEDIPNDEIFDIYLGEKLGNFHFDMGETMMNYAFVDTFKGMNLKSKYMQMIDEVFSVPILLDQFGHSLIEAVWTHHFDVNPESVEIPDPIEISKVAIPAFIKE